MESNNSLFILVSMKLIKLIFNYFHRYFR